METALSYLAEHFDLPILEWIAENLRCAFLDTLMPIITLLGDAGIFWIALALVLLCTRKYRKTGAAMGVALVLGLLICNVTMKPLVARIRPYDYQLLHFGKTIQLLISAPTDYSFPSGHTLASFEGAVVLTLYNKKLGIPALVLASLIAFSRLYLYVHYPTDVLAALIMGVAIAFLAKYITEKTWLAGKRRALQKQ